MANYNLISNRQIAPGVFEMLLSGAAPKNTLPGQFVNVRINGLYLRRPISLCDYTDQSLSLVYKVVGEGTHALSKMRKGASLDLLTNLGNGFDLQKSGRAPLLIGGGVGVPPLYALAKALLKRGLAPQILLGFNTVGEIILADRFRALGLPVFITTADGSFGTMGLVTDALKIVSPYDAFYACGPLPMLKALSETIAAPGQLSLEARMACGFGACMGCSIMTKDGPRRVCKDGPVFDKEALLW